MIKTILIDDEPIALEVLELMLKPYEDINIIASYTKYADAIESLKKEKPDVIFLDIEIGDVSGLELAEVFMEKLDNVEIIFVTAYSQYAVDAFEVNAMDYLLKPIQEKRLLKAVERLRLAIEEKGVETDRKHDSGNKLKIYSFGGFQVLDSSGSSLCWRTQKAKELFAYLWYKKEKPVSKDLIIEYIFPDKDIEKVSALVHTTIYQIRKALEKLGYPNGIIYIDESYQLNISLENDLEELSSIIDMERYNDEDIANILEIYRGDFLVEGYNWGIETQQMYKNLVIGILGKFIETNITNQKLSQGVKNSLDKLYEIDPLNEDLVKMTVHYYGKQNNKSCLKTFFNDYTERLWKEMRIKPMKSTMEVYKKYMKV